MSYFSGEGKPLDDKRLTLSGTTPAGEQQYRIWHDGQQILVPRGQSITKPDNPENVAANTMVFGSIKKGYFQSPVVEFRNTNDFKLFDRFNLAMYRDDLPTDPDTTLDDLGFYLVDLSFTLIIKWHTYEWQIPKYATLIQVGTNLFRTPDSYHITTYSPFYSQGMQEYNIEIDTFFNIDIGETAELGELPFGGHKLHMGMQNCRINRGSSEYLFNPYFNPTLPNIEFSATDIKVLRGWG